MIISIRQGDISLHTLKFICRGAGKIVCRKISNQKENPKKNVGGGERDYIVLKNTVLFIPFAPKNFLQNAAATEGAYSLQLNISI